jgi:YidC/Oxa1 family membrane protein insertase
MVYQGIFDPIANVLGVLMKYIYLYVSFENYGIAIVIFTIITRLMLLPLNIKQTKSMSKIQKIQPELKEIQAKYKNDKERLNQATMDLYKKHQVNPAGGCLPLLIQMPLLFSLYYVIRQPLKFMFRFAPEKIELIGRYIVGIDPTYKKLMFNGDTFFAMNADLPIIKYFSSFGDKIGTALADLKAKTGAVLEQGQVINMNFLGIKLGEVPTIDTAKISANPEIYLPLLIIPLLAAITTYLSSKSTQSSPTAQAGGMGKSMMFLFPAMTLLFTFSLPAGLGLYWIVGNIIQIIQQKFMNKHLQNKDEEIRLADEEKKKVEAEEKQKLIEQREFDKDLLKNSNVSKKKLKNLIERDKNQNSNKDVK